MTTQTIKTDEKKTDDFYEIIAKDGKNALIHMEGPYWGGYTIVCARNYKHYLDNGVNESVVFTAGRQAPQEVKDNLLKVARDYFNTLQ